jgi:hypothetical protein
MRREPNADQRLQPLPSTIAFRTGARGESGVALLLTLITMLLLSALAAAMVLLTSTEALIAASFRGGREAFYAADAVGEWSLAALGTMTDEWTAVCAGLKASSFVDGAPAGPRTVAGQPVIDLTSVAAANPGWHLFAYGTFSDLVRSRGSSPFYVVSLVAQDPAGLDNLRVRAMVFGAHGARRTVELALLRSPRGVHVVSWAEGP